MPQMGRRKETLARTSGVTCLSGEMSTALPRECIDRCAEAWAMMREELARTFGGVTMADGVGVTRP